VVGVWVSGREERLWVKRLGRERDGRACDEADEGVGKGQLQEEDAHSATWTHATGCPSPWSCGNERRAAAQEERVISTISTADPGARLGHHSERAGQPFNTQDWQRTRPSPSGRAGRAPRAGR